MTALLEVKNLSVDIPLAAGVLHPVQDLTFSVDKGETLCIVGESGCGKTTIAKTALGLVREKSGTMRLDGRVVSGLDTVEKIEGQPVEGEAPADPLLFAQRLVRLMEKAL